MSIAEVHHQEDLAFPSLNAVLGHILSKIASPLSLASLSNAHNSR